MALLAGCTPVRTTVSQWPEPSPTRPVVDLSFTVAQDLSSVIGTETIEFTPDLRVCELVFRAWPNKPITAASGSSLEVTEVSVDGVRVEPVVERAGAPRGSPGTLVEVPLARCVDPGRVVTAQLTFEVTLGRGVDERVGTARAGDVAWFATAFPLLAWEEGRGWAREPAQPITGEMATSEVFELRSLEVVVASAEYAVMGAGEFRGAEADAETGLVTHRFTAPAVRDVAVTVGLLEVLERDVGGVRVHVGAPAKGLQAPLSAWADEVAGALERVRDYLGPIPYDDIWVSVLPDQTDGIEFPGAVQFGDHDPGQERWLLSHEVAHMWLYGLVGNNQARDPWLDESFASFVQAVVDDPSGEPEPTGGYPDRVAGAMGASMEYWAEFDRPSSAYIDGVYWAGSEVLLEARHEVGADAFDEALRAYIAANAHEIATPQDVEDAFADVPRVLEILREAGAL